MTKLLIDTNAILRFLLRDIPEQASSVRELLEKAKSGKISIVVIPVVVFEVFYSLHKYYKLDKNEIIDKLENILSSGHLIVEEREILLRSLLLLRNLNIGFVDCYLLVKAESERADVFSFDIKLNKSKHL